MGSHLTVAARFHSFARYLANGSSAPVLMRAHAVHPSFHRRFYPDSIHHPLLYRSLNRIATDNPSLFAVQDAFKTHGNHCIHTN